MDFYRRQKKSFKLIDRLQTSRDRLTPIVNDVIISTVALIQKGECKIFAERVVTMEQYEEMVRASFILKEAQCKLSFDPRFHKLPNTNVIVNKVTVGDVKNRPAIEGNGIVVDEQTIFALLEVYEKIGEIIKKLTDDGSLAITKSGENVPQLSQKKESVTVLRDDVPDVPTTSPSSTQLNYDALARTGSVSRGIGTVEKAVETSDSITPQKRQSTGPCPSCSGFGDKCKDNFQIKIMCKLANSDTEDDIVQLVPLDNSESGTGKQGQGPVKTKREDKGCCINAETQFDQREIKITIKPYPNCRGTKNAKTDVKAIEGGKIDSEETEDKPKETGSPHSIKDKPQVDTRPESPKRTDDKKQGTDVERKKSPRPVTKSEIGIQSNSYDDEGQQTSTSFENKDKHPNKGCPISQITINIDSCGKASDCVCDAKGKTNSQPKLNVVLDVDSVDKSSVQVQDDREEKKVTEPDKKPAQSEENVITPVKIMSEDDKIVIKPETIVIDPENVVVEPDIIQVEPKEVVEPDDMVLEPETIVVKPEEIEANSDENVTEPEKTVVEPDTIVTEPEDKGIEPEEKVTEPEKRVIEPKKKKITVFPLTLLTRQRTCSSLEFDVSTVNTRLKNEEIDHKNTKVAEKLRELGVDNILRASRPAKCCRKAVLNEKQRAGLPYAASLRSLPLTAEDADVIQESLDMSLKKIKNSLDLAEDKGLESDHFQSNLNFPWVVPVYKVTVDYDKFKNDINEEEKFFILKEIVEVEKTSSESTKLLTSEESGEISMEKEIGTCKFYILKKPEVNQLRSSASLSIVEELNRLKDCNPKVRFEENDRIMYGTMKPHRHKSNFLIKRTWKTVSYEEITNNSIFFKKSRGTENVVVSMDKDEGPACGSLEHKVVTNFQTEEFLIESSFNGMPKKSYSFVGSDADRLLDVQVYMENKKEKNVSNVGVRKSFSDTQLHNKFIYM